MPCLCRFLFGAHTTKTVLYEGESETDFSQVKVKSMRFQGHPMKNRHCMCYGDGTNGILIENTNCFSQGQVDAISRSSDAKSVLYVLR